MPEALSGSWYSGEAQGSSPYDPATGAWGAPLGEGLVYVFEPDGTYTRAFQSYFQHETCTMGLTVFEQGNVIVDGTKITTDPTSSHIELVDTCAPAASGTRPLVDPPAKTFEWRVEPGAQGGDAAVLRLLAADGTESELSPL